MKRFIAAVIFLLIVAAIGVTLIPTDRNRIKKVIGSCRSAVLKKDVSGVMEHVSFNYSDDTGGSYLLLKKRLEIFLNRFSEFKISYDVMEIGISGTTAEVELKASVSASEGNERTYLVGDAAWPQDIKAYLEKSPARMWKITRVEGMVR